MSETALVILALLLGSFGASRIGKR
jgi:hypothetical protein